MNDRALSYKRLEDKNPELQKLLRHLSQDRFAALDARPTRISDHPSPDDFVYGSHLSVIQIASRELRITFKSHFKLAETQVLTQKDVVDRSASQILQSTYDLFMEYSNLVAGGLKKVLYKSHIIAGISLPMATSGFDELIASDTLRESSFLDTWIVAGQGFRFVCSVQANFLDDNINSSFRIEDADDENEGKLEIL